MTIGQALRLAVQRMDLLVFGAIFGAVLGIVYSQVGTSLYQSTAEIILSVKTPDNVASASLADQLSPEYLFTQVDIIESDQVALLAAQSLGLINKSDMRPDAPAATREAALHTARLLRLNMRVVAGAGFSRVIDIQYVGGTAAFAAAAANSFADAFKTVRLQLEAEPARDAVGFYDRQVKKLAEDLRAAQALLIDRQRELGIPVGITGSVDSEVTRLQALGDQLAGQQRSSADAAARGSAPRPETLSNGAVEQLQFQIAQARAQRDQLLANAGANNPQVLELNAQIAALQASQRGAQGQLATAAGQTAAIEARGVQNLSATIANQKDRAIGERAKSAELDRLVRDVTTRQELYNQAIARRAELRVAGTSESTDVAILSPALPTPKPIWPSMRILAPAGAVVGGILAAIAVFILQIFAQRIRKRRDLGEWLGIEALSEIRLQAANRQVMGAALLLTDGTLSDGQDAHAARNDWKLPEPSNASAGGRDGVLLEPTRLFSEPQSEELFAWHDPVSASSDDLRDLRTALLMPAKAAGKPTSVIAFLSAADDERRPEIVSNLAILFAKGGFRTLLIDGDVGRRAIDTLFGLGAPAGLSDYLEGGDARVQSTMLNDLPYLTIVGSGGAPLRSDDSLASQKLGALIEDAAHQFDYVLINSPAADTDRRYMLIARLAGSVIFVTRQKVTRVRQAALILNALDEAGVGVLGGLFLSKPRRPWGRRLRFLNPLPLSRRIFRRRALAAGI